MREILFRGQRADNKEWVYGDVRFTPQSLIGKCWIYDRNKPLEFEVLPETVGQYTGLKDKNGKEIYEGDICRINNLIHKWKYSIPKFDWRVLEIIHNQYLFAFSNSVLYLPLANYHDSIDGVYDYDIEVIGNKYENPEHLEEQ